MSNKNDDTKLLPWLRRTVKLLQPDAVFVRNMHVVVILSNGKQLPLKAYKTKLESCRLPQTFSFALHYQSELERQYRLGNLFLTTFCVEHNCVYRTDEEGCEPL